MAMVGANRKARPQLLAVGSSLVFLLAIALPGRTHGKSIDYSPDIVSERYWQTHFISLVRVSDVGNTTPNPQITLNVLHEFGDAMAAKQYRIPLSYLWGGKHMDGEPPPVKVGDTFVLYLGKTRDAVFVVTQVKDTGNDPVVRPLRHIELIRRQAISDNSALSAGCSGPDGTAILYCLNRIMDERMTIRDPAFWLRLRELRDRNATGVSARIRANELLLREGKVGRADAYAWLKLAFADSGGLSWGDLDQFAQALLTYSERREETVGFLLAEMDKHPERPDVAIAVYGALIDPRAFNYAQPTDETSVRIVDAYFKMLSHGDPTVRAAAAGQISALKNGIRDGSDKGTFRERALKELTRHAEAEQVPYVRELMEQKTKELRGTAR